MPQNTWDTDTLTAAAEHGSPATLRTAVSAEINIAMQLFVIANMENQLY